MIDVRVIAVVPAYDRAAQGRIPATIEDIARRMERLDVDQIYGGWWWRVVIRDGPAAVRRSADRYLARLRGERPGGSHP